MNLKVFQEIFSRARAWKDRQTNQSHKYFLTLLVSFKKYKNDYFKESF